MERKRRVIIGLYVALGALLDEMEILRDVYMVKHSKAAKMRMRNAVRARKMAQKFLNDSFIRKTANA